MELQFIFATILELKSFSFQDSELRKFTLPLALLHSILVHRRYFGTFHHPPEWTHQDFLTSLHQIRQVLLTCHHGDKASDVITALYGGHCHDDHDLVALATIVEDLLPGNQDDDSGGKMQRFESLMEGLRNGEEGSTFEKRIELLADPILKLLAIDRTSEEKYNAHKSR